MIIHRKALVQPNLLKLLSKIGVEVWSRTSLAVTIPGGTSAMMGLQCSHVEILRLGDQERAGG